MARVGLSGRRDDEQIPDGRADRSSLFGQAILRALKKAPGAPYAGADVNQDGCVAAYELTAFVNNHGRYPGVDTPYYGPLPRDRQGIVTFCDRKLSEPEATLVVVGVGRREWCVSLSGGSYWLPSMGSQGLPEGWPGRLMNLFGVLIHLTAVSVDDYTDCVRAGTCTNRPLTGTEWPSKPIEEHRKCNWSKPGRRNLPINRVNGYC